MKSLESRQFWCRFTDMGGKIWGAQNLPTESSGRKQTVNGLPMRLGMVRPGMVWLAEAFCWKAFVYSGLCGGGRTSKMTRCGLGKAWHGVSLTLKSSCLAGLVQGEGGGTGLLRAVWVVEK